MRLAFLASALALSAALAVPARADVSSTIEGAQRLDSLETFLSRYVGRCTDPYERKACEANVAQARKAAAGKTFVVRVTDAAMLVRPERRGDGYVLLFTPFIDGGGLALTQGAPAKQDAQGRPLMSFIPIDSRPPPGVMDMEFESPFRTGAIELEIAFRPERTWRLSRKGEGLYEGVAAHFVAVRVINSRTGSAIAEKAL
jgi:hypothetical protein